MDIIERLRQKPFVHIIAQARSGSTALYDALCWPNQNKQSMGLSEKLKPPSDRQNLDKICAAVEEHDKHGLKAMKNLLIDILAFDKPSQDRLFALPVYTVGLIRRNSFDQICSDILHDLDDWKFPHQIDLEHTHVVSRDRFRQRASIVLSQKRTMYNYSKHYDEIIYYEDLVFPSYCADTLSHPKQKRIANYQQCKVMHQELMREWDTSQQVQTRGITWTIDKTNK